MNENDLRAAFHTMNRIVHIARGALRRLRPHVLDADARAHVENLKADSEPFRRLPPAEHTRVEREVHHENLTTRRRAASIALHYLRDADRHVQDWRRYVRDVQRDVSVSFPQCFDRISPDGMIMLSLLRSERRRTILTMTADQMMATYETALRNKDASTYVDAELIEETVLGGLGLALEADDLPVLKKLREYVEGIQALRVPTDLPDYEQLAADISALQVRANLIQVAPVRPEYDAAAAAAYEEQAETLLDVGSVSDREDIAAVQQELAKASGE